MEKIFKVEDAVAIIGCGAVEAETISKTRASLKSHTSKGNSLRIALTITAIFFAFTSFAQDQDKNTDYAKEPKANERIIGTVANSSIVSNTSGSTADNLVYVRLLEQAKKEYPNKVIDLRNFKRANLGNGTHSGSATVVELNSSSPETKMNETLVKAVDKSMSNVRGGSRLAIDQVSVSGGLDRTTVNDQLIDVLLDRGYRVVAKEYLEKLKEEQEQQTSGGFNEKTTAKTANFSGVGYFLNVRVNEKSIRIQVINVSTGEYEGNATVEF